jgi:hypothetical protein
MAKKRKEINIPDDILAMAKNATRKPETKEIGSATAIEMTKPKSQPHIDLEPYKSVYNVQYYEKLRQKEEQKEG